MNNTSNILISTGAFASLLYTIFKIRRPFKQHSFNTFAYIILLLIMYSLVVRSFYFFVDKPNISPKLQGFISTYPSINLVICSYLLSNQWVYDLLIFIHGNQNQFLERQIKVFVVTSIIFIVIIYFVYAISLPQNFDQQFQDIFYFIAIFEIIVSLLLMCSILLYVKRIILFNQRYGRFAFALGIVFIIANVMAGSLNFYLGSGGYDPITSLKTTNEVLWAMIFIPFFIITEFVPAITFAIVMEKYGEEQSPNNNLPR